MTAITLNIPENIRVYMGIKKEVSYENLIIKSIGKDFVSPDLNFTKYYDMSEKHKEEYNKLENINKNNLLNI